MVRIVSMVLLAVKKFRIGGMRRRVREGKADAGDFEKMKTSAKFSVSTSQGKEALDYPIVEDNDLKGKDLEADKTLSICHSWC